MTRSIIKGHLKTQFYIAELEAKKNSIAKAVKLFTREYQSPIDQRRPDGVRKQKKLIKTLEVRADAP